MDTSNERGAAAVEGGGRGGEAAAALASASDMAERGGEGRGSQQQLSTTATQRSASQRAAPTTATATPAPRRQCSRIAPYQAASSQHWSPPHAGGGRARERVQRGGGCVRERWHVHMTHHAMMRSAPSTTRTMAMASTIAAAAATAAASAPLPSPQPSTSFHTAMAQVHGLFAHACSVSPAHHCCLLVQAVHTTITTCTALLLSLSSTHRHVAATIPLFDLPLWSLLHLLASFHPLPWSLSPLSLTAAIASQEDSVRCVV